ncbi:hypothetical protein acdb102_12940 [Acidothermaceae bacterium B102]|nr:hypothetical protein acdb102_12940 [Acidothermaceae bacterium B102]
MSSPHCPDHNCVPQGSVLSHTSAAKLWTLPLPGDVPDVTHVTLPMSRGRWAATSATVHRRDLAPQDIVERDGVHVTSPLRTLLDLPSVLSLSSSVAAADAAMRAGLVSRTELRKVCAHAMGRGARAVRDLGRLADPSADSPMESEARVLLTLADLTPEATQYVVKDGDLFVGRVEFAWPSQGGTAHGRPCLPFRT